MSKKTTFTVQVSLSKTYDLDVPMDKIEQNLYELFESELLFTVDGIDFMRYDVVDGDKVDIE